MSPYLFIIVADVLQQLIINACSHGDLAHPLCDDIPCPVLQYADDTLIMIRATPTAAANLKRILDDFAHATGLQINFNKTTFVPISITDDEAISIANTLGTTTSAFPQTYLGLPLSDRKLPPSAFQPIIDNIDKYLSGWRASLLSKGGRLVLLASVLDSLPTHFMSSLAIPISIIKAIDSKRRAFFWAADDTCSGAQCLVAWDKACTPKNVGGLGVKNLNAQNVCLLLKLCYKFLHATDTPWKDWLLYHSPFSNHSTKISYLGKIIAKYMPMLSMMTRCTLGSGSSIFFWHDRWLLQEPLADAFPALYSHYVKQNNLVMDVLQNGVEMDLRNWLTNAATSQLALLLQLLQGITLSDEPDRRVMLDGSTFSMRGAYCSLQNALHDTDAERVWNSKVPAKLKMFGWLLLLDRINTRENLHHKHILEYTNCPRCPAAIEDRRHLFFTCPRAALIWQRLGITHSAQPFECF